MTTPLGSRSLSGLFSKVSLLLTSTFLVSAFGTYLGAGITSTVAIVVLAVLFFLGAFLVPVALKSSTAGGVAALTVWTLISGLFLGPCIHMYVHTLGWQTVFLTYLGTGGVMAACGAVASFSGINFGKLGNFLTIALLALIVTGIFGIFVPFSAGVNIVYSLIGMAVFTLFFLFDFFRLSRGEDTWEAAVLLTMELYLDYINFLLYALRLIAALAGSSSNKD